MMIIVLCGNTLSKSLSNEETKKKRKENEVWLTKIIKFINGKDKILLLRMLFTN